MQFVVKDLLISVLPVNFDIGRFGTCQQDSEGPPCSGVCPGSKDPITAIKELIILADNPVSLANLKLQLHEQLAMVEHRVDKMAKSAKPLSNADVSMLQSHLGSALKELDQVNKKKA